ncbi:ATP-binding protein [Rhodanobacter thiooxydans]|uniref:ATP-binding protein n=1 Tax=Rhodanobacter thiooxydans TaxID=416169 RepID=UPI000D33DF45|nr:ATP-binding protein [Rhodanobacter thiooxydans]
MIRPSLNRRLVLRLLAGIVLVWCAAAGWLAWRSLHEVDEIFDQMLVRTAASVFAVMPATPVQGGTARLPDRHALDSDATAQRPAITVRNASGQLLIRSTELPALSFDPGDAHFHSVTYGQRRWRVFQRWDAQRQYWIQVGAPLDERDELMRKLLAPALLALLALLGLVPPIVFAGLRSGLKPLRELTRGLSATAPVTAALTDEQVPVELAPFTEAIDRLVARLQLSLQHERRFTADAAHELRHPLAALRLELDLAGRGDDAPARAPHLQRAQEALDRMQRLVTQLLMLARVEKLTELDDAGPLRLSGVAEAVLCDASERAAARSIELSLDHGGNDFVLGSRGLLVILVQNLLDNALRHVPDHGRVDVRVGGHAERVTLEVDDNGTGFASTDTARLGERFHRPEGSVGEGSGLGLSIAQAIAGLHHGELVFGRSALGGARVSVSLPRIATNAPHAPDYA